MVKKLFEKIKNSFGSKDFDIPEEDESYIEVNTEQADNYKKILVKPYILEDFSDVKLILDEFRERQTIALVFIKPLKDKDIIELKRAINKMKKTCDAIGGDIAGFGEDWIALVPDWANIYRGKKTASPSTPKQETENLETY